MCYLQLLGSWLLGAISIALGIAAHRYYQANREFLLPLVPLEPGLYELCPECWGEGGGCMQCFDYGVVEHACE